MAKCLECCESQYGNYIMQHILEKGPHTEKETLLEVLRVNFVRLSLNKFARYSILEFFKPFNFQIIVM